MKTKSNISTNALNYNGLTSNSSSVASFITAALLSILFIGLADKIDTGIDLALFTQQTYEIQFV